MSSRDNEDSERTELPTGGTTEDGLFESRARGAGTQPSVSLVNQSGQARYERGQALGQGGMGEVLEVLDRGFNRRVAMKTLRKQCASEKELDLFVAEAQINSQLEHPNLVPVHDIGVGEDGQPYFTMRLVRGHRSLKSLIQALRQGDAELHARYTFERRVQLIQQVCHALSYAHERGVVHCDIKPANIVVGDCGELFVVDWGISKVLSQDEGAHPHGQVQTSEELASADASDYGTARYMSPERMRAPQAISASTDIYSLSAVLYELLCLNHYLGPLTNTHPFTLHETLTKEARIPAESYVDPNNGRVPRTLSRICNKGLSFDIEDRFQSVGELQAALQAWLEGRIPMVCPGTTMQRLLAEASRAVDKHPVFLPIATLVTLSMGGIALVLAIWDLLD